MVVVVVVAMIRRWLLFLSHYFPLWFTYLFRNVFRDCYQKLDVFLFKIPLLLLLMVMITIKIVLTAWISINKITVYIFCSLFFFFFFFFSSFIMWAASFESKLIIDVSAKFLYMFLYSHKTKTVWCDIFISFPIFNVRRVYRP